MQFKFEFTVAITLMRILKRNPDSLVPDDNFTRPILSSWNLALESIVGNGMIFDVNGHALIIRIEARSLGNSPAFHGALKLQPEVIMQAGGPMFLNNER